MRHFPQLLATLLITIVLAACQITQLSTPISEVGLAPTADASATAAAILTALAKEPPTATDSPTITPAQATEVPTPDATLVQRAVDATLTAIAVLTPMPTDTPTPTPSSMPTPMATSTPIPTLSQRVCYGLCWEYDESAQTMTWTGPLDGIEDVWQGDDLSLGRVRIGWTAIFGPMTVPGEIEACILTLNGQAVVNDCSGVANPYQVDANQTYRVTSTNPSVGGFRWKPKPCYGYRACE